MDDVLGVAMLVTIHRVVKILESELAACFFGWEPGVIKAHDDPALVVPGLIQIRIQDSMFRIQGHAVSELTAEVSAANSAKPLTNWSRTAVMLS